MLASLPVFVLIALAWAASADEPILTASLDATGRQAFYDALSSAAGALLGFSVTTLAILVALPSTETVKALRKFPGWQTLFELLVATIVLLGLLLVLSLAALVADVGDEAREPLAMVVLGTAGASAFGIAAVTLFFSLVVAALIQEWRQD